MDLLREKDGLDSDWKPSDHHIEYKDGLDSSDQPRELEYPEALKNMPDAPSMGNILAGLERQKAHSDHSLGQQCRQEWRSILAAMPYIIANIGYGFDNGVMNITTAMPAFLIKFGHFDPLTKSLTIASTWISLWTAMFSLGLFLGTLSCAYILDRFGPRKAAMAASIALIGAVAVQVTSESREQLLAGKLLAGIPLGMLQVAASNFIAESAPSRLRGPLAASIGMANIVGIILGIATGSQVIHFVKSVDCTYTDHRDVAVLPTSPVYLVKQGKPTEAAAALDKLHGPTDPQRTRQELAVIQYAVATEMQLRTTLQSMTLKELFIDPIERKRTLTSIGLWFCYQAGGNTFTGQGLYFLQQQGLKVTIATNISLGCLSLSALSFLLAGYVMERVGRRILFVYFHILHFSFMLALGLTGFAAKTNSAAGWAMAVLINLAVSTQSFATGGTAYALTAEISSLRARAKTQSLSLFTNKLLNFGLTFAVPYIYQEPGYLGAKTSLIFAGTTALAIIWSYFMVPETSGRSALQIDALYHAGVAPRKFADTDIGLVLEQQQEASRNAPIAA